MRVHFTATANEQLESLPPRFQVRIVEKVELYASQPDPLEFAEPLTGSDEYRFRVGNYRIIFEVLHNFIWIKAIKRRDEAYR